MSSKDEHKERQRVTKGQYLDPTKKRGPPKGAGRYINAIEDRLHRMEAIVGGLVREDDPLFHSRDETSLRSLLSSSPLRNRGSRDSYNEKQSPDAHFQAPLSYQQHQQRSNLDHQHHPPPLHDYGGLMKQHQQQPAQLLIQYPQQHQQQQQPQQQQLFIQQPYPNRALDMQVNQSPDLVSPPQSEGIQQSADPTRVSPLHRDLIRESTFQSFSSPSPILSSDHSVTDYAESPTTMPESLPKLGMNTPPVPEVDDLEDDMGHLTLDQRGRERYVGKSSPMFYSRRHYGGQQSAREQESQKPEALKFIDNPDLPSPEVMTHLLNLHFTYVHPFAPVFVWSKFLKRLQDRNYTPSFIFLLNCIFALSSRFSDDVSFRTDPDRPETIGDRFADKAKEILDTLYDSADMYCVGALVLLAFQQMGTGNGYRSWMYVGISIRMAQHLGMNRNCVKLNPRMPALDREERNRIWWTCFMADRIISTSFGRPQGINEHDVDAAYPEGIDEENTQLEYKLEGATSMLTGPSPHSEKKFVYMASLMRILGRVMVSLYSPMSKASSKSSTSMTNPAPLEQLDKELTDWLLTLPPHLQFRSVQQEPGTFVCTLHMTFYAVLILLHRPYSHRSSHNVASNDPSISLSICTSAANNTIEMASNMMRAIDDKRGVSRLKGLLHNSVFIFFTAGIVHITNCTSTDPVLAASAKLRTIETLKCLAIVEDVWMTGKLVANNIKQLLKARNIELPYSTEALKNLPLGSVEDMKNKFGTGSAQMDISMVAAIPKEQTFAFDVGQIMGYYQGNDAKHTEPMGRNSRHFSPTPYFSSVAGHHHFSQAPPMKSHPGLTQGHSPLPRRPRQGKNTSPSPGTSSTSSAPSSAMNTCTTPTNGFFPSMQQQQQDGSVVANGGLSMYSNPLNSSTTSLSSLVSSTMNSGNSPSAVNAQIDPFAAPGSATLITHNPQQQQQQLPLADQQSINMYQNPFSSSLWDLPTSMDNEEWLLYMQNGGGNTEGVLDLDLDTQNGLGEIGGGHSSNSTPNSGMHPLAQNLTRNELFDGDSNGENPNGGMDATAISSSATSKSSVPASSFASDVFAQQQPQQHQSLLTAQDSSEHYFLNGNVGMNV
ncbi:hypothetical protein EDD11_006956 [Mortierella claussenii]|nr:hypothetical protein EDD11_006956 [Mortierella claussenii]